MEMSKLSILRRVSVHAPVFANFDLQMLGGVVSAHAARKLNSEMDLTSHWRSCWYGNPVMPCCRGSKITMTAILHLDYRNLPPGEDVRPAALCRSTFMRAAQ